MARLFVLRRSVAVDGFDDHPSAEAYAYDPVWQLWVSKISGQPFIEEVGHLDTTKYGETLLTATSEGVDQTEVTFSAWGETTLTRTSEGVDTTERTEL